MEYHSPTMERASVIIPGYNEERTISSVVKVAKGHPLVGEVIVIADGCCDHTARRARKAGADLVIELPFNRGKGQAMDVGAREAKNDVLVFLDADAIGLTATMLTQLIEPVLKREQDMTTFKRDWWMEIYYNVPILDLCGERCLRKSLWYAVPPAYREGFKIETALNYVAQLQGLRKKRIPAPGLSGLLKEQKRGLKQGFSERFDEIIQCTSALVQFPIESKKMMKEMAKN